LANIHSEIYDEKCKRLFEESNIRFAGILDEKGKIVSGGFKPGKEVLQIGE